MKFKTQVAHTHSIGTRLQALKALDRFNTRVKTAEKGERRGSNADLKDPGDMNHVTYIYMNESCHIHIQMSHIYE